jgi:hypothetical protein
VEKLTVDETPKVKSKNLNVVQEFEKSGMKRMANFVVIGKLDEENTCGSGTDIGRPCRSRKEHPNGTTAL